uniref:uncharacterized protein n=1 Tax=Semicossyphus pulcher TaxID=241346 RepID=UPI0037E84603
MDAESLQKSDRRRSRCLDVFLVVSIIFLFVALTAVAAGGVITVRELRSKLDSTRPPVQFETLKQSEDTPDPAYKMQNFVYLEMTSSKLETSTVPLAQVFYGASTSVGSNFMFDQKQNSLTPLKAGTYFLYIDLNITCNHNCSKGVLTVSVDDKLTCEVKLPDLADITPVTRKCWTVMRLDGQKLFTQMTVPKAGLKNWQLELKGSGIGMFHVA